MRKIHIYCDGGFGNRLNGLVSGLLLARLAGLEPVVVWPRNNWCGAAYSQLFQAPHTVSEDELTAFIARRSELCFVMTEDHLHSGVAYCQPLAEQSADAVLQFIASHTGDVLYHTPLIPAWMDMREIMQIVRDLPLQAGLWAQVNAFLDARGLTDYIGVHIRKTDFGANGSDDDGLFTLLANCPQKQFFVCSDDAEVELRFGGLPHVVTYPKRAYVERRVEGGWNTETVDHSGRLYACNVERGALSVEDAVIDLLILAYSQILDSSKSTFRNSALLIKAALQLDGANRTKGQA